MTCSKCGTENQQASGFCQACGAAHQAGTEPGRTVLMAPAPGNASTTAPDPRINVEDIVRRARKTFGDIQIHRGPVTQVRQDQREQTVFVDDVSGSMGEPYDGRRTKLQAAANANVNMVLQKDKIDPLDEIGLVTFNHQAQGLLSLCPISSHKPQIITALQGLTDGGGTDINKGLKAARDLFDWSRNGVVRRIVLLTDGHGGHPLRTAEDLKSRGVVIDVVGVGAEEAGIHVKLLRAVCSVIQGEVRYRFIKDHQTLVDHYTYLATKTSTR